MQETTKSVCSVRLLGSYLYLVPWTSRSERRVRGNCPHYLKVKIPKITPKFERRCVYLCCNQITSTAPSLIQESSVFTTLLLGSSSKWGCNECNVHYTHKSSKIICLVIGSQQISCKSVHIYRPSQTWCPFLTRGMHKNCLQIFAFQITAPELCWNSRTFLPPVPWHGEIAKWQH